MKVLAIFGFLFTGYTCVYGMELNVPHAHEVSVSFDCVIQRVLPQRVKTVPLTALPNLYRATETVVSTLVRRNGFDSGNQGLFKPEHLPSNFLSPEACVEYYQAMHGVATPPDKNSELLKLMESLRNSSPEKFHLLATGVMNDVLQGQNQIQTPANASESSNQAAAMISGITQAGHIVNGQIDAQQMQNRIPGGTDFMQYMFNAIQTESTKKNTKITMTQRILMALGGFIVLQFGGLITAAVTPRS